MSAGQNTVVSNKFVRKEFDPFKERTISWLSKEVTTKIDKSKDHKGYDLKVKLAHWKSETYDFIRFSFSYSITSTTIKSLLARTQFNDVKFNYDLENIQSINFSSERTTNVANKSAVGTAAVDFTVEDCRKILTGKKLEIRIYRDWCTDDLDDAFEGKICDALASLITNGVDYDWQAEADRLEKLALEQQAMKPKSFLRKLFSFFIWSFGLIFVLGALSAIFGGK